MFFVDLSPLRDPAYVTSAIASALGISEGGAQSLATRLGHSLAQSPALMVLDNFEHVLAAAPEIADLLAACPELKVLVTSRSALRLRWEHQVAVLPLPLPESVHLEDLETMASVASVALFLDRARAAGPDLRLTGDNATAIMLICQRLDGLPLALELAAVRVKLLRVEEIAAYLDNCFRLLTGGSRGAAERHQTLQAAIDWSYDLLTHAERVLLRRLAVFAGGFTMDAAQGICVDAEFLSDAVFDLLALLVDQSLVIISPGHYPTRYRMLEPIRQYAQNRLLAAGEAETVQRGHAHFFVALAEQAEPQLWAADHSTWMVRLQQERGNLQVAVQWAVEQNDAALGVRLARALYWFWLLSGAVSAGRNSVAGILEVAVAVGDAAARASALQVAGSLAFLDADYVAACGPLEESATIYRRLGDRHGLANTLNVLGRVRDLQGDTAIASTLLRESAALASEVGDHGGHANALLALTLVAVNRADYAEAHAYAEEALTIYQNTGNQWGVAAGLQYLADVARCQGNYTRAERLYLRSQTAFRDAGVEAETASILHNLGYVSLAQGEYARAQAMFAESLAQQRERGNRAGILEGLAGFGALLAARGQPRKAAVLFGAVAALRATFGTPMWPAERIEHERHVAKVRAALGAGAWQEAMAEGGGMTLEQAIASALAPMVTDRAAQVHAGLIAQGGLTTREREVLILLAQGNSNRVIADALIITERTVETHIRSIRSKLNLTSRTQLAIWAVEQGLLGARS
ncbi:MAG: LuxR C-terminal-related transcriptional regulator [Chloroflexota bacterium]|nr:LuxR C-terminal-related transcriptional regulator [Chloroflexota bacterium]